MLKSSIPFEQRLVLADYCYHSLPHRYYYNHCGEYTGAVPYANKDFDDWHSIKFLDCKLSETVVTHADIRSQFMQDLNKFLNNTQPLRVLHLAPDSVEHLRLVQNFTFTNHLILELHLHKHTDFAQISGAVDNWLGYTRPGIIMTTVILHSQRKTLYSPTTDQLYAVIQDCIGLER